MRRRSTHTHTHSLRTDSVGQSRSSADNGPTDRPSRPTRLSFTCDSIARWARTLCSGQRYSSRIGTQHLCAQPRCVHQMGTMDSIVYRFIRYSFEPLVKQHIHKVLLHSLTRAVVRTECIMCVCVCMFANKAFIVMMMIILRCASVGYRLLIQPTPTTTSTTNTNTLGKSHTLHCQR